MWWLVLLVVVIGLTVLVLAMRTQANEEAARRQDKRRDRELRMSAGHRRAVEFEQSSPEWPIFQKDGGEYHKEYLMIAADQSRLRRLRLQVNPDLQVKDDFILAMEDIVSVEIQSSSRTILQLEMNSTTKKSGTLGRAIVGGVVAGPVGALVGASSAGSTTTGSLSGEQKTIQGPVDLVIGTTDLNKPVMKMRMPHMGVAEMWLHRVRGAISLMNRAAG